MNRMPGLVELLEKHAEEACAEIERWKQHKQNGGKFVNEAADATIARFTKNEAELRKWITKLKAAS